MIEDVTIENIDEVLPLIAEYQEFYGVENIDLEKNSNFFSQFTNENNDSGSLYLFRRNGQVIGFITIYKGFSSTQAESVAILNDLYIKVDHRGNGFAKKLINHALNTAKSKGYSRLQWLTAHNNKIASIYMMTLTLLKARGFSMQLKLNVKNSYNWFTLPFELSSS